MSHEPAHASSHRLILFSIAAGWTAFALYGSLVPLNFTAVSLDNAIDHFRRILANPPRLGSRADWATNFLLLLPSAFFGLGAIWSRRSASARLAASAMVIAVLVAVAVMLEFLQVWVPGRIVSQLDIEAQWIGATVGVVLWWLVGRHVTSWLSRVGAASRPLSGVELLLLLYTVLVVGYGILPLDLTISPIQILEKVRHGKVILIPFTFADRTWEYSVYSMASEVLLWAPVGAYWTVRRGAPISTAAVFTLAVAFALEAVQLFVVTRTVDINDLIAALAGGALGATVARRLNTGSALAPAPASTTSNAWLLWGTAVCAWVAIAATVYWYPFEFRLDGRFLRHRVNSLRLVPFYSYYWGSEFNATTQLFRKAVFFVPLGMLLAAARYLMSSSVARRVYALGSGTFVVCAAIAIELGQIAIPGKIPDPTDAMLGVIGAGAGWATVVWLVRLAGRHGW
jgi:VanZ family protein